jgi:hypothetical protein
VLADQRFTALIAPSQQVIVFEHSRHRSLFEEPDATSRLPDSRPTGSDNNPTLAEDFTREVLPRPEMPMPRRASVACKPRAFRRSRMPGRSGSVQPAFDVRLHQAGADPTGGAGHGHTGRAGQHRTQFQGGEALVRTSSLTCRSVRLVHRLTGKRGI